MENYRRADNFPYYYFILLSYRVLTIARNPNRPIAAAGKTSLKGYITALSHVNEDVTTATGQDKENANQPFITNCHHCIKSKKKEVSKVQACRFSRDQSSGTEC